MQYGIKKVREAKGMTQKELADAIGTTQQSIQRYEAGSREPSGDVLMALSKALNCPVTILLGLDDQFAVMSPKPAMRQVPVIGSIAAGTPREAIAQSDETWWLLDPSLQDKEGLFYLKASGDSMNMLFPDGALILVDEKSEIHNGDVAVVFVNGDDATVKRIFFVGDTIVLHPESSNAEHKDRIIDPSDKDAPSVRIIGKVIGYTSPQGWKP